MLDVPTAIVRPSGLKRGAAAERPVHFASSFGSPPSGLTIRSEVTPVAPASYIRTNAIHFPSGDQSASSAIETMRRAAPPRTGIR